MKLRHKYSIKQSSIMGFALISLASASGGCMSDDYDYYADVVDACGYVEPTGSVVSSDVPLLTQECKEAMLSILPLDEESWALAPSGHMDLVIEALQIMVGYPLALPPENRILGGAPNMIHAKHLCVIAPVTFGCPGAHSWGESEEPENLNRNLFNHIMSRIDRIAYLKQPEGDFSTIAWLRSDLLHGSGEPGVLMHVTDLFGVKSRFLRASAILHEAWHADSRIHVPCEQEVVDQYKHLTGGLEHFSCDRDTSGPYTLQALFGIMLVHGSLKLEKSSSSPESKKYVLSEKGLDEIAMHVCTSTKYRVSSIRKLLDDLPDCTYADGEWLLMREGLMR